MTCQIEKCNRVAQERLHFDPGKTLNGQPHVDVCLYHYLLLTMQVFTRPKEIRA